MKYFSTSKQSPVVDFREATIRGQAPDKGLYFPETTPVVDKDLITQIADISDEEIALRVMQPYIVDSIPVDQLRRIIADTINFPMPLVKVDDRSYALELFHGPTLAFKDIGARFMSRCLGYFLGDLDKKVTVLVATSGDTGGAVANGFYEVDGVEVVILYPSGKVSSVQEKQLTSPGKNISALEIDGSFDDCQQLVKQAFADASVTNKIFLTSANSINVARWLPQQLYYFFAYKKWNNPTEPPVFCVPSGNFGNICAGILAYKTGLPVAHFVAACNINDIVSDYLETGILKPKPAMPTLSNAMDVGNPSNFVRILEIFAYNFPELKNMVSSHRVSDQETIETIRNVFQRHHYVLDPHGAVAFHALEKYLDVHPGRSGIFLETAHPVKFPDAVEAATGQAVPWPASVAGLMDKPGKSIRMKNSYADLKEFLLK